MKKGLLLLLLSIISTSSLFSSMAAKQSKSSCCDLGTLIYKVSSKIGRNDYLYLAHKNSLWFLKKKIELKENQHDLDAYYRRFGTMINDTSIDVYYTPLHEAVKQGNLDCVKLLCAAGADKKKKIEEASSKKDIAEESLFLPFGQHVYQVKSDQLESEVAKVRKCSLIGLSAIELAQKLLKDAREYDYVSTEQRKAVYNFLND